MNKFQEIIKIERVRRGLTIEEAANKMEISRSILHRLETSDDRKPKMDELKLLSNFYEIGYDDLCFAAERVPEDVYYKLAKSRELYDVVRKFGV